jgi:PHYB activation tagged suppressor 1
MVKQVLFDRNGLYPKNIGNPHIARLLGKGLVLTDGDDWKRHRKVVHPAFNMDKLKVCTDVCPAPAERLGVCFAFPKY